MIQENGAEIQENRKKKETIDKLPEILESSVGEISFSRQPKLFLGAAFSRSTFSDTVFHTVTYITVSTSVTISTTYFTITTTVLSPQDDLIASPNQGGTLPRC